MSESHALRKSAGLEDMYNVQDMRLYKGKCGPSCTCLGGLARHVVPNRSLPQGRKCHSLTHHELFSSIIHGIQYTLGNKECNGVHTSDSGISGSIQSHVGI